MSEESREMLQGRPWCGGVRYRREWVVGSWSEEVGSDHIHVRLVSLSMSTLTPTLTNTDDNNTTRLPEHTPPPSLLPLRSYPPCSIRPGHDGLVREWLARGEDEDRQLEGQVPRRRGRCPSSLRRYRVSLSPVASTSILCPFPPFPCLINLSTRPEFTLICRTFSIHSLPCP
jgi:hypothetical protein